jgi:hypothetical protein
VANRTIHAQVTTAASRRIANIPARTDCGGSRQIQSHFQPKQETLAVSREKEEKCSVHSVTVSARGTYDTEVSTRTIHVFYMYIH